MLGIAENNSIFLLNSPYPKEQVWDHLPRTVQQEIIDKKSDFTQLTLMILRRRLGLELGLIQ